MADFLMQELFPVICNMSVTASAVILAVLAVRLLLRRAPKVFSYALWAVVLFRLLCPVSVNSAVSLMGALGAPVQERTQRTSAVEYVPADIVRSAAPEAALLPGEPAGETAAPPAGGRRLPVEQRLSGGLHLLPLCHGTHPPQNLPPLHPERRGAGLHPAS